MGGQRDVGAERTITLLRREAFGGGQAEVLDGAAGIGGFLQAINERAAGEGHATGVGCDRGVGEDALWWHGKRQANLVGSSYGR